MTGFYGCGGERVSTRLVFGPTADGTPALVLQSKVGMGSALKRLRGLATLAAWGVACLPALAQPPHADAPGWNVQFQNADAKLLLPLPGGTYGVPSFAQSPSLTIRSADLDADGDLDLVTAGTSGIRTWLNTGHGRFVEQSPARTLLRLRTDRRLSASHRRARAGELAVSVERPAVVLRAAVAAADDSRPIDHHASVLPFAARAPTKGGSRAPPSHRS